MITESDNVSTQLLDIILINIVEPQKSSRKNAYYLAKELIIKTNETMEQYITQVNWPAFVFCRGQINDVVAINVKFMFYSFSIKYL